MSRKTSLIIIEDKETFRDEKAILSALGKIDYQFDKEVIFDECLYPNDKSINIGYYKGNIIISDDFQITDGSLQHLNQSKYTKTEKNLIQLFPNTEILMVACHSTVNYHGYLLISNGVKQRGKSLFDDDPLEQFGERIAEEQAIYKDSFQENGENYWSDSDDLNEVYAESIMYEEFTFGIAKRRLGFYLDSPEGIELLGNLTFRKYVPINSFNKKNKWKRYGLLFLGLLT